ncbi:hypothetical protein VPH46_06860 [Sphingomonas sp. MJ1 (PH-R8)]|uniref:hypothetical protein n=1 Tax=Sphingomonas sp. MJ1 (PH-R8) TaxID=3112950 RepID=UPI003A83FFA5
MLVVSKKAEGPAWLPVMGAQVLFDPIDRKMMRAARRAAVKALRGEDAAEADEAGDAPASEQLEELGDALSVALILAGALDWKDVCRMADGEDTSAGEPLPFSRENLEHALSDPLIFDAFDQAYVMPFVMRERTKNVSAASQSGTGEAATPESGTASSPAKPEKAAGAKPVRTGSKSPTPRKRKASGKS